MRNPQTAETEAPSRIYFNVVDEDGKVHPAVEYWAATLDDEELSFQILPISKFVRLLGSKEALIELDGTRFRGCRTERVYAREPNWPYAQGTVKAMTDESYGG